MSKDWEVTALACLCARPPSSLLSLPPPSASLSPPLLKLLSSLSLSSLPLLPPAS